MAIRATDHNDSFSYTNYYRVTYVAIEYSYDPYDAWYSMPHNNDPLTSPSDDDNVVEAETS